MKYLSILAILLVVLNQACDGPGMSASKPYTLKLRGSESMHETFNALKSDFEKMQDTVTIP